MKKLVLICLFMINVILFSDIINIPDDYGSIQNGIVASVDTDTILVQPGTYFENLNYLGKNITVASLFLTTQDTTYISQTIIDGNQSGSVVIFENNEDSTAVLTGLTIQNGSGNEFIITAGEFQYYVYKGGGIYCELSYPKLNYLIVRNNLSNRGGGIYIQNNPDIEENQILNIDNCTIDNNEAENGTQYMFLYKGQGGGIFNSVSKTAIHNVHLCNNLTEDGGGIYSVASELTLNEVVINSNQADNGVAVNLQSSTNEFNRVVIYDNYSTGFHTSTLQIFNSELNLTNSTICNNTHSNILEAMNNSNVTMTNSILWNNSSPTIIFSEIGDPNQLIVSYSDIENGEAAIITNENGSVNWLEGNIDIDPIFFDPENNNYHLTENSPCIDAGNPNLPYDPDSTITDMGAYYFHQYTMSEEFNFPIADCFLSIYPNPFNPTTTVSFDIEYDCKVELSIYNIKGRMIRTLISQQLTAGTYNKIWDGKNDIDIPVSSGIYFIHLMLNNNLESVKKCVMLK